MSTNPFMIGITGGTASGKTTVSSKVHERLAATALSMISMDSFYRPLTPEERLRADAGTYNFDGPDAVDWPLFLQTLDDIKSGKPVQIPEYCFKTHSRLPTSHKLEGSKVVIIEGILALYHPDVRSIFDLKIFVEADSDLRLARRLRRDIAERGRTVDNVLTQYERTVKPSFEQFTHPTKQYADIIIPFNHHNAVAIDLVVDVVTRAMGHQHKHHQH